MVDRPIVYRLVDGVEERVATRTIGAKGETLVAEAVGEFVLRNGQKTVCIKVGADGSVTVSVNLQSIREQGCRSADFAPHHRPCGGPRIPRGSYGLR